LVVGLASVIIGEAILGKRGVVVGIISAVVGSIVYRFIVAFVLSYNICGANMMKLMCAVVVAVTLAIPSIKSQIALVKLKKEARKNA
jgi:putative ABC transport system permease protein